jgi:hypothetical protein
MTLVRLLGLEVRNCKLLFMRTMQVVISVTLSPQTVAELRATCCLGRERNA